jgi:hypothetical protein
MLIDGMSTFDVEKLLWHLLKNWNKTNDFFDQMLCLGARNEDVRSDVEGKAVELTFANDVLDGLAFAAAFEEGGEADRRATGELFFAVSHEPGFVFANVVEEESLGVAAGAVGVRAVSEEGLAVLEPLTQFHYAATAPSSPPLSASAW